MNFRIIASIIAILLLGLIGFSKFGGEGVTASPDTTVATPPPSADDSAIKSFKIE